MGTPKCGRPMLAFLVLVSIVHPDFWLPEPEFTFTNPTLNSRQGNIWVEYDSLAGELTSLPLRIRTGDLNEANKELRNAGIRLTMIERDTKDLNKERAEQRLKAFARSARYFEEHYRFRR